ncbi:MAG: hypothetical protein ACP5D2_04175 [Candidatus Nanoarchaeia archaeon]
MTLGPLDMIIGAVVFIFLDKMITLENINTVAETKSLAQAITIEKNPLAKWLFVSYGLGAGTILMSIVSAIQFLLSWILLNWILTPFSSIPDQIAFYILAAIYIATIINNSIFLIKFKLDNKKGKRKKRK